MSITDKYYSYFLLVFLAGGLLSQLFGFYPGTSISILLFVLFILLSFILRTNWKIFLTIFISTLAIEIIGVKYQIPFGSYEYTSNALKLSIADVPLFIPLAWYVFLTSARQVSGKYWQAALIIFMVDILLERFAAASGLWIWANHQGMLTAPLQNYLVWSILAAAGYFIIPKNENIKLKSKITLILLVLYFAATSLISG